MTRFLAARNAPLSSVKAVVLTHYHPDHMGNAERLRAQAGAAVLVHHDDGAAAMRKGRPPLYPLWKPPVLHLVGHFLRNGVARTAPVAEASGFADEEVAAGRQAGQADRGQDKLKGPPVMPGISRYLAYAYAARFHFEPAVFRTAPAST